MKLAILIVLILAVLCWVAWNWLPVGNLHGRTIVLRERFNPNTRLHLKLEQARKELELCRNLPPDERLKALVALEERRGDVFLGGDEIRRAIVATGRDECLPIIRRWLEANPYHGQGAVMGGGVEMALQSGTAEEHFKVQIFQMILPGLDERDGWSSVYAEKIPGLLLDLDQAWGERVLRSPEYLNPDYKRFRVVVEQFNSRGILIPRALLESWLPRWDAEELGYLDGITCMTVLRAMAGYDAAIAEGGLSRIVASNSEAGALAAEALLELRKLPHPRFHIWDKEEKLGRAALSPFERTVWLVDLYNYGIDCGGLATFEHDEKGDHLPEMIAALRTVGSHYNADRLEAFCKLFGPGGPPRDEATRSDFVHAQGEEWMLRRGKLEDEYSKYEDTKKIVLKYILDNARHFERVQSGDSAEP